MFNLKLILLHIVLHTSVPNNKTFI